MQKNIFPDRVQAVCQSSIYQCIPKTIHLTHRKWYIYIFAEKNPQLITKLDVMNPYLKVKSVFLEFQNNPIMFPVGVMLNSYCLTPHIQSTMKPCHCYLQDIPLWLSLAPNLFKLNYCYFWSASTHVLQSHPLHCRMIPLSKSFPC